jgi:hypothetical protein
MGEKRSNRSDHGHEAAALSVARDHRLPARDTPVRKSSQALIALAELLGVDTG